MKRFVKILAYLFITGGILFGVLLVLTQTAAFKNWLGNYLLSKVNRTISGRIEVSRFDGNLFSHLQIDSLVIRGSHDTLAFVPRIEAHYTLLPLLKGEITVDSLVFHSPRFTLLRRDDASWNFQSIFRSPEAEEAVPRKREPSRLRIRIGKLNVIEASVSFLNAPKGIPTRIGGIFAQLSGFYSADSQAFRLYHLALRTENPALQVTHFALGLKRNARRIELSDFVLKTAANHLKGSGEYFPKQLQTSHARLEAQPVDFSELEFFLPRLRIPARPRINLRASMLNETLRLNLVLAEGKQRFSLQGKIVYPFDFARTSYKLRGEFRNWELRRWFGSNAPALEGNGNIAISGSGVSLRTARFDLQARLWDVLVYRKSFSRIRLEVGYRPGALQTTLSAEGNFGTASLTADVLRPLGAFRFRGKGELNQFNLETFHPGIPASDLNARFSFRGEGVRPQTLHGNLVVRLSPSTISDLRIDTLFTSFRIERKNLRIDSLQLRSNLADLNLWGAVRRNASANLHFLGKINDLTPTLAYLPLDTLASRGTFRGKLYGSRDSLQSELLLSLEQLLVNNLAADSVRALLHFRWNRPQPLEAAEAVFRNLRMGGVDLDSLNVQAAFQGKQGNLLFNLRQGKLLQSTIHANLSADSTVRIQFPDIKIRFKERLWHGGNGDMAIIYSRKAWHFRRFELTGAAAGQIPQRLFIDGTVSPSGQENLEVALSGFRLDNFNLLRKDSLNLKGTLDLALHLTGEANTPVVKGNLEIRHATIESLPLQSLNGRFGYRERQLFWNIRLKSTPTDSLIFSGSLPAIFSLKEKKIRLLSRYPLRVSLTTGQYRLNSFSSLFPHTVNLDGKITSNLNIYNTLENPRLGGTLKLTNGRFGFPELGLDYRQVEGELVGDSTRLRLKYLQVIQPPGSLRVEGFVQADSALSVTTSGPAVLKWQAEDFPILNTREYQVQVSSHFLAEIDSTGSRFDGTIRVTQSNFYLPPLFSATAKSTSTTQSIPLLVQATREARPDSAREKISPVQVINRKIRTVLGSRLLKDFSGKLTLAIPENTWLKSPEMRLEIQGEVELVKEGEELRLYGQIDVIRGYYSFIGKNFEIRKGKLTFRGETEFDPEILLETEYQFRSYTHELKTMKLNVNGKMDDLDFYFSLDGKNITQADAISYILFGRSKEDLLYGDPAALTESTRGEGNRLLLDVAAGVLSTELTQSLGKELNIDKIEIKSKDNWEKATFVVGKYLTNNLFVSYQREFGASSDDEVAKETIMVEYEIRRNLFLQLLEGNAKTKGLDIIFKFER